MGGLDVISNGVLHCNRVWHIPASVANLHFPSFFMSRQVIDLELLARNFATSGYVSTAVAHSALKKIFGIYAKRPPVDIIIHVERHLHNLLRSQDLDSMAKLRGHFITIAHLACEARSSSIAECLLLFFLEQRHLITQDDRRHLEAWGHGIRRLAGLVSFSEIQEAMVFLKSRENDAEYFRRRRFSPWDEDDYLYERGRRVDRYGRFARSRTMPPAYHVPMPRVQPQHYLPLSAPSPLLTSFPSPAIYARSPVNADIEHIKEDVHFLAQKIGDLAYNQQALAQGAQPDAYGGPLLLGWSGLNS